MSVNDGRRIERFDLELFANLVDLGSEGQPSAVKLRTVDVSANGAFFRTDNPLEIGTAVDIEITLPLDELKQIEGKRALIKVSGAVVRSEKDGMGVSFDEHYQIKPIPT